LVVRYLYDARGNCTIASSTTNTAVANANPIRYRGYYYDDDAGLYYCNARYYSPKWRRFISPDDTAYLDPESVNGLNLYCYCGNDPINYCDPSGSSAIVIGAIIGAVLGFGAAAYIDYRDDGHVFNGSVAWYDYLGATLTGGAIGAGIAYCLPTISSFAGSSFSFGGRTAMLLDGTAVAIPGITVTGAQILITVGTAMTLSTLIMFVKGSGRRLGHNQHENQMWEEAMRQLKIKNKDKQRRLHDAIRKYPYQDTLKGLLAILNEILEKWGQQ
jgi:RHS repeat-associated protein